MTLRQVNLPLCHFTNCLLKLRESFSLLPSVYALQICLALVHLREVCVGRHLMSVLGVLWVGSEWVMYGLSRFCADYLFIVARTVYRYPLFFVRSLLRRDCTRFPKWMSGSKSIVLYSTLTECLCIFQLQCTGIEHKNLVATKTRHQPAHACHKYQSHVPFPDIM